MPPPAPNPMFITMFLSMPPMAFGIGTYWLRNAEATGLKRLPGIWLPGNRLSPVANGGRVSRAGRLRRIVRWVGVRRSRVEYVGPTLAEIAGHLVRGGYRVGG